VGAYFRECRANEYSRAWNALLRGKNLVPSAAAAAAAAANAKAQQGAEEKKAAVSWARLLAGCWGHITAQGSHMHGLHEKRKRTHSGPSQP